MTQGDWVTAHWLKAEAKNFKNPRSEAQCYEELIKRGAIGINGWVVDSWWISGVDVVEICSSQTGSSQFKSSSESSDSSLEDSRLESLSAWSWPVLNYWLLSRSTRSWLLRAGSLGFLRGWVGEILYVNLRETANGRGILLYCERTEKCYLWLFDHIITVSMKILSSSRTRHVSNQYFSQYTSKLHSIRAIFFISFWFSDCSDHWLIAQKP